MKMKSIKLRQPIKCSPLCGSVFFCFVLDFSGGFFWWFGVFCFVLVFLCVVFLFFYSCII